MRSSPSAVRKPPVNSQTVLDASALLALIQNEAGANLVKNAITQGQAVISAVNLSEVIAKLAESGMPGDAIAGFQSQLPVEVVDFNSAIAMEAGLLRPTTRPLGLSLGDRSCLATAMALGNLPILTADRVWAELKNNFKITVLR
ncbi:MAG: type II toxin-antitoxin system VapC family toxin [Methylococcaceae bacterium]|nr:type II toxin-antitoxin system VapC family toxin [Methylococcaceae bacterium]